MGNQEQSLDRNQMGNQEQSLDRNQMGNQEQKTNKNIGNVGLAPRQRLQ